MQWRRRRSSWSSSASTADSPSEFSTSVGSAGLPFLLVGRRGIFRAKQGPQSGCPESRFGGAPVSTAEHLQRQAFVCRAMYCRHVPSGLETRSITSSWGSGITLAVEVWFLPGGLGRRSEHVIKNPIGGRQSGERVSLALDSYRHRGLGMLRLALAMVCGRWHTLQNRVLLRLSAILPSWQPPLLTIFKEDLRVITDEYQPVPIKQPFQLNRIGRVLRRREVAQPLVQVFVLSSHRTSPLLRTDSRAVSACAVQETVRRGSI